MGKVWKTTRYGARLIVVYILSCAVSKIVIVLCAGAVIVCVHIVGMVIATAATVLGLMGEGTWLRSALSYVEFGGFSDDVFRFSVGVAEKYWRLIAAIGPIAYIVRDRSRKS